MYSGGCFFELAKVLVGTIVIGILIHFFLFTVIPIKGESMKPNLQSGNWVILDKISYIKGSPLRGDIVGIKFPGDPKKEKYIKRVIGLPGEKVEIKNGKVLINSQVLTELYLPVNSINGADLSVTLKDDEYFLVGDNRINSADSRIWGAVTKRDIIGKARFVFFPFNQTKLISSPYYPSSVLFENNS
jgi:signal peptidase I